MIHAAARSTAYRCFERMTMRIDDILKDLGVPQHLRARDYLKTALLLRAGEQVKKCEGVERLYAAVAELHETSQKAVDRGIRYAIDKGYDLAGEEVYKRYFGSAAAGKARRVTNKQFIETVAELAKEDENCSRMK